MEKIASGSSEQEDAATAGVLGIDQMNQGQFNAACAYHGINDETPCDPEDAEWMGRQHPVRPPGAPPPDPRVRVLNESLTSVLALYPQDMHGSGPGWGFRPEVIRAIESARTALEG